MGHAIHKHMNSFKAKNLLSEMPIDNKASALEMEKGSAAYMKDDMAPKMESPMEKALVGDQPNLNDGLKKAIKAKSPAEMNKSALYHVSTGHGKHVSPERSHSDGQGGMYSSHSHDTQSQKRKDKALTKKQRAK